MNTIRIDLFADIVCPWCYIGETRLQKALKERPDLRVEWNWRPFQLEPHLPERGTPWKEFARTRFGGTGRAQTIFAHVAELGATAGIEIAFDRISTAPNTRMAHSLILMAGEHPRRERLVRRLFHAYFAEGANIGDVETLAAIAGETGLNKDEVRECLQNGQGADEVERSQREAEHLGVTGVPFFIFNGRYAFSGAQSHEAFLRAIDGAMAGTTASR